MQDYVKFVFLYSGHQFDYFIVFQWFLSEKADNGKNDPASLYKFKGDYHCFHKNFNSAIDCYKYSLGMLTWLLINLDSDYLQYLEGFLLRPPMFQRISNKICIYLNLF